MKGSSKLQKNYFGISIRNYLGFVAIADKGYYRKRLGKRCSKWIFQAHEQSIYIYIFLSPVTIDQEHPGPSAGDGLSPEIG